MPTWQFENQLNQNQTVSVPPEVAAQLQPDETIHVVLVSGEATDEAHWKRLAAEQFRERYAPGDDEYRWVPPTT
jgi:hypothetical protein